MARGSFGNVSRTERNDHFSRSNGADWDTDADKNKDLIRRWIAFANAGFAGNFDQFIAVDYMGHLGATAIDRSELERLEQQFCLAFLDAHHAIDELNRVRSPSSATKPTVVTNDTPRKA